MNRLAFVFGVRGSFHHAYLITGVVQIKFIKHKLTIKTNGEKWVKQILQRMRTHLHLAGTFGLGIWLLPKAEPPTADVHVEYTYRAPPISGLQLGPNTEDPEMEGAEHEPCGVILLDDPASYHDIPEDFPVEEVPWRALSMLTERIV